MSFRYKWHIVLVVAVVLVFVFGQELVDFFAAITS
jgi:hypothetical protein